MNLWLFASLIKQPDVATVEGVLNFEFQKLEIEAERTCGMATSSRHDFAPIATIFPQPSRSDKVGGGDEIGIGGQFPKLYWALRLR